ncbi:hypothetical protein BLA29_012480 [Euroglyphus maynei]|uniref:Uncharacterized protein n=1 Tax=Euroglyphus maynei TaxID=6958 RepID=A0A1Y3BBU2_EURMA|nr:hypothetical protein BLA29_012480 [Euroglyphus maynei]
MKYDLQVMLSMNHIPRMQHL